MFVVHTIGFVYLLLLVHQQGEGLRVKGSELFHLAREERSTANPRCKTSVLGGVVASHIGSRLVRRSSAYTCS